MSEWGAASPAAALTVSPAGCPPRYDLARGLFEFCSSQADAMLAHFRNINQLLGPTKDWTAPGTLCEVLIRDLIRRMLPSRYSVDKGFVFGRCMKGDKEVHSPEVDVLIHDTHEYAPVYRLGDFVIVRPDAVRAVIQVKRTLDGDKLQKAIANLVDVKQHLKSLGAIRIPNNNYDIFSAAFFFADDLKLQGGGISSTYASIVEPLKGVEPLARPHFLGSLENRFYVVPFDSKARYDGFASLHGNGNVALVTFLGYLTQYILPRYSSLPLYRPVDHPSDQTIQLDAPDRSPS